MTESIEEPQATSTTSKADADHTGESAAPDDASLSGTDSDGPGVADSDLPEDLQPGEDNPLAAPLDPEAEETKDAEELGMQDTQDDTTGTYRSEGELGDADTTSADADPEPEDDNSAK